VTSKHADEHGQEIKVPCEHCKGSGQRMIGGQLMRCVCNPPWMMPVGAKVKDQTEHHQQMSDSLTCCGLQGIGCCRDHDDVLGRNITAQARGGVNSDARKSKHQLLMDLKLEAEEEAARTPVFLAEADMQYDLQPDGSWVEIEIKNDTQPADILGTPLTIDTSEDEAASTPVWNANDFLKKVAEESNDPVYIFSWDKETPQVSALHKDEGKLRVDLVPPEALEGIALVLDYGLAKYAERNWERGMLFSRMYGSVLRHLTMAWWNGNDIDDESGLHHLDHALCDLAFLVTWIKREMTEWDDRPRKGDVNGQTS